ncbi:uncharacterized protein LOC142817441 [Rhipicephalus microplus]|uniref:uncharacterized protein LOC142817441 n=1 Tax=Rhipicephalus microplus TaxID=6941 RepID=UPI003F6AF401
MIGSLHRDETMVKTLNAFLILNTGTTLFCYVGHIAACKFASKYAYVLYYIYSFYVECKQAAALPPVIAPVAFVASTGGGTAEVQESMVVLIRESSATTMNASTGWKSVSKVQEVVRVSGEKTAMSPSSASTQNEANGPSQPSEVTSPEVKARSPSDESVFGGSHRQSQQTLEIPDFVFPAVRTGDGAVAGPSRPRHGPR